MRIRTRIAVSLTFIFSLLSANTFAVPIANQANAFGGNNGFFGIQLRGVSYEANGELVEVHVSDRTFDSNAYGAISIVDNLNNTLFRQEFVGGLQQYDFNNPGSVDFRFVLPYNIDLTATITTREFSASSIWFGSQKTTIGSPPTSQTQTLVFDFNIAPVPEAASLGLLGLGLLGLGFGRLTTRRRTVV